MIRSEIFLYRRLALLAFLAVTDIILCPILRAEEPLAPVGRHEVFADSEGNTLHREMLDHPDDPEKKIELIWAAPEGEGPWPVILYVHPHQFPERPGANAFIGPGVLPWMTRRVGGLLAAAVSQPGYGRSDGPPDFCGPETQRAVEEAIRHLRAMERTDGRVVLYGYSRGAIVSSVVATRDPELAGLVLGAGAYDVGDQYAKLEGKTELVGLRRNIEHEGGLSEEALSARSALGQGGKIKAPTLILHGEDDGTCPVDHAKRLAAEIEAAGTEVELVIFPETGHNIPFKGRHDALYPFLDRVLGPPEESSEKEPGT